MDTLQNSIYAESINISGEKQAANSVVNEGKFIPKHRFDCINISLKEHKAMVAQLKDVNANLNKQVQSLICRLTENDRLQRENQLLRELISLLLPQNSPIKE